VERPEQIKDLVMIQRGRTFTLSFTPPSLATDGERLTKPLEIEIYRTITPRGATPAPWSKPDTPAASLKPDDLRRLTLGDKVVYAWDLSPQEYSLSQGATYSFAVRGLTYGFRHRALRGQLSNVARATLLDVSGPVQNLRAHTTKKAIEIEWAPPGQSLSGGTLSALSGYRVFRSATGKAGSFELLAETDAPSYSDADFAFDHTYTYKVRAEFKGGQSTAESEDSRTVEITPHDIFPPAAPRDVTAIYAAGAVEIVWSPSPEPDLAGYNVLRRNAAGAEVRMNKQLVRTPVFKDAQVEAGRQYFYRVTAVDLNGNESPPSNEVAVETH
jgi:fibronectin type 3 domain-containing protein